MNASKKWCDNKKRRNIDRVLSFLLICTIAASMIFFSNAASLDTINKSDVYLKQKTSVTCTLCSCTMIMRRTAVACGRTDYKKITEEAVREDGWVSGIGLLWQFNSFGFTIGHDDFPDKDRKQFLLKLLDRFPQGVEVYNTGHGGQDHAIVITDYDKKTDTFYAADPASSVGSGRIKLNDTSIYGKNQAEKINNLDAFWFVESPRIYNINGDICENNSYNSAADDKAFSSSKKNVGEYFVVTDSEDDSSPIRYSPSGNSSCLEIAENGTILFVESVGKNSAGSSWYKISGGGYTFADNLTKFKDYSAEIKKFNSTAKSLNTTYTIDSIYDSKAPLRLEPAEGNNIVGYMANGTRVHGTKLGKNSIGTNWIFTDDGYYIKLSDLNKYADGKKDVTAFNDVVRVSGLYSSLAYNDVNEPIERVDKIYKTTASWLNVRVTPGDGYSIDAIPEGTTVNVTLIKNGWGYISLDNIHGWICLDYAKFVKNNTKYTLNINSLKMSSDKITTEAEQCCLVDCTATEPNIVYKYSVIDSKNKVVQSEKSSLSSLLKFKTTTPGKYRFVVSVSDSHSNTVNKTSDEFTVVGKFKINSITAKKSFGLGTPIEWKIDCGSGDVMFLFEVLCDGTPIYSEQGKPTGTFTYVPITPGEYTLAVTVFGDVYEKQTTISSPVLVSNYNVKKGDVNLDGAIHANDARLTLRYTAKLEPLSEIQIYAADTQSRGNVNASDARTILRVSAGLESLD